MLNRNEVREALTTALENLGLDSVADLNSSSTIDILMELENILSIAELRTTAFLMNDSGGFMEKFKTNTEFLNLLESELTDMGYM